jgi:hypothetical protein
VLLVAAPVEVAATAGARGEARAGDAREVVGACRGNREQAMEVAVQEEQKGTSSSPRFL